MFPILGANSLCEFTLNKKHALRGMFVLGFEGIGPRNIKMVRKTHCIHLAFAFWPFA